MGKCNRHWMVVALMVGLAVLVTPLGWAQPLEHDDDPPPMGPGPHDREPGMGPGPRGLEPAMRPGMGPEGPHARFGRGPKGPRDPELDRRMQAIQATAEAYRNLAEMFEKAGKTDDAATQLKKIIALHDQLRNDTTLPEPVRRTMTHKVVPVNLRLARLLVKANKLKEAEAILVEASKKAEEPEIQSRLLLELANIYRDQGKLEEAQKFYQQVIDNNAAAVLKK